MITDRPTQTPPARTLTRGGPIATILAGFLVLAVLEGHRPSSIDLTAARELGMGKGTDWFQAARVVSFVGSGPVVAVLAVAFAAAILWQTRELFLAAAAPVAAATAGVVEVVTKQLVQRPRPRTSVLTGASGYSFPSGHTTGFTALVVAVIGVVVLLGLDRRYGLLWRLGAGVVALSVATSRVVLGAHWLTDVIGGLLLGAAVGMGVTIMAARAARVAPRLNEHFARRPVMPQKGGTDWVNHTSEAASNRRSRP